MGGLLGIVALADVDRAFRTALLWYVLGDARYAGQGHTSRAVAALLSTAFSELGLNAVSAWVVEGNSPSLRVLERNHFRSAGRFRACHYLDGRPRNHLLLRIIVERRKGAAMSDTKCANDMMDIQARLTKLIVEDMSLQVPGLETDLISAGYLDSISFVDLLQRIESEFAV